MRRTFRNARRLYIPMSGGTDSTVAYCILCQVYPEKTFGIHIGDMMPESQRAYLRSLGGTLNVVPPVNTDAIDKDTARWAMVNSMCRTDTAWLIGTRNRTEEVMGNYSLASRIATTQPLLWLWKVQVMELAAYLGVPEDIIASSHKADHSCGRPQEMADIGIELVDFYASCRVHRNSSRLATRLAPTQIQFLDNMYYYNRFKANLPMQVK